MLTQPLIIGLGEALWDIFPEQAHLGGAPSNFAIHVASLIGKSYLISSLGKDDLGQKARDLSLIHI